MDENIYQLQLQPIISLGLLTQFQPMGYRGYRSGGIEVKHWLKMG